LALHRSHCTVVDAAVTLQLPPATVNALPTIGVPLSAGCAVANNVAATGAIGPATLAYAALEPPVSRAVTVSPIVLVASAATSV